MPQVKKTHKNRTSVHDTRRIMVPRFQNHMAIFRDPQYFSS